MSQVPGGTLVLPLSSRKRNGHQLFALMDDHTMILAATGLPGWLIRLEAIEPTRLISLEDEADG